MQKDSRKFIAGAGISGLVWKFYHPEYQIISPEVGGTFAKTYMVWLHDTIETRKLLSDLGWENPEQMQKKSYIGYYYKGWIFDYLTQDINMLLIQKKMTEWDKPIDKNFVPKSADLSLSVIGGSNYMNTLDVDLSEIIRRLSATVTHEEGRITQVTPELLTVTKQNGEIIDTEYDSLISSIPAPVFWESYGKPKEFKYLPITNVIVKNKPEMFDDHYEMVYYDDSQPITRISHLNNVYALEFTGYISQEKFSELFPLLEVVDYFVTKYGRIFEGEDVTSPDKIVFTGRFAQWKYKLTTEHIIKQAINYNEK